MSSQVLFLICFVVLSAAQDDFSRVPESQNVGLGLDAVFHCQHRGALSIGWLVNEVPENQLNDHGMFIKSGNYRDENNSLVFTLTILARPEYNGTIVECAATFLDSLPQKSPPVTLTIEDTCGSFTIATTFTIMPMLGVFADGSEARFRCHHRRSNRITFEIDGLSVNDSLVENASIVRVPAGNGRSVFVLTFEADQVLDGSMIICVAIFTNGCPNQETFPALLLIQGPLSTVTRFRRLPSNQVVYSWTPPPTLDLTDVSPDIVYSIEVYNITCGANDLLSSQNNLNVSLYQNALLDPGHVYEVVIVPRSNVPGSRNGTTFTEYETFEGMNISSVALMENSSGVVIEFGLQSSMGNIHARWYSLFIHPLDEDKADSEMSIVLERDELMVRVLPRRWLWFVSAVAYDCEEHQVSNTVISTHDVQDVSVRPITGGIIVTGHFIDNSRAVGVLLIAFSFTNKADINYTFVQRPSGPQEIETTLTGLSIGDYQVSVFVVDDSGLPFNRSAYLPSNVSVSEVNETADTMDDQPVISFNFTLQATSTRVCITCTFLDNSTTDCVAVVHQRISHLNSSGLMNIESSHKFNRSGDTAYGCIEGVNLEQYQVGVVGGSQFTPHDQSGVHPENDFKKVLVPAVVGVAVFLSTVIILLVITIILLLMNKKKFLKRKEGYQVPKSGSANNNGRASASYSNENANPIVNVSVQTSKAKETASIPQSNLQQNVTVHDGQFTETHPLLDSAKKQTNTGHSMLDNTQDASSKDQTSFTSLSNNGDSGGGAVPEQGVKEIVSSPPVTEGNRPESQELVGTAKRKLQGVNSAETQLKSETSKVTTVASQLVDSNMSSPHDVVFIKGDKKPAMSTGPTAPQDHSGSDELSTTSKTGENSSLHVDNPEASTSIDSNENSPDKPTAPPQDEHSFRKRKPQTVSYHGDIPHTSTIRPTPLDSEAPSTHPVPSAAALNFVQQSMPKTEEEMYSAPSDFSHSEPFEETKADKN